MKVNEPDSLVCWSDRMMVRVSPLATADSVEFGATQAATNAAATATRAAAPPRLEPMFTLIPANKRSFPNTMRPAAKPEACAFPFRTHTLWPGSLPPTPTRPAERTSRRALDSDPRIVTKTSQLGKKRFESPIAPSRGPFNLDSLARVCPPPSGLTHTRLAFPAAHRIRQRIQ